MGTRWLLILLIAAAAAGGAGYYYWQQRASSKLSIETVPATRGDVRQVVSTSGTVSALGTVEIGSQLSGNIGELNADFSSEVKEGQVLARIEPSTFETKVREEEAGIAIAKANVALQEASVARAEANLHKSEIDLSRAQELVRKGVGAQATLDAAMAAQQSAAAELEIAKAQVENAKATLAQRQATLDSARIDLERTYIRSPIDGVVIERTVEVGQTVAASMTAPKLFTIAQDLSKVQIEAQVDEADIGQVTSRDPVTFTVDAYPDVTFEGQVEQIRLAPTELTNVVTYTVVIGADNPLGQLLPGMTANVEIVTGEKKDVVIVPNKALRYRPEGALQVALISDDWVAGVHPLAAVDRRGPFLARLKDELELDDEVLKKVNVALDSELATIRNTNRPDNPTARQSFHEQVRARIAKALRVALRAQDYRRYEELERQRSKGPRRATLWIYENGFFVPREVRLGLAGMHSTEVQQGLNEGAAVVVQVREVAP